MPEKVSITATARRPPKMVYAALTAASSDAKKINGRSVPNIERKKRLPL